MRYCFPVPIFAENPGMQVGHSTLLAFLVAGSVVPVQYSALPDLPLGGPPDYHGIMILFFIKKAFFDGWDNLFALVGMNLGFIAILGLVLVLPLSLGMAGPLVILAASLAIACLAVWYSTAIQATLRISDYGSIQWKELKDELVKALVPGLQIAGIGVVSWLLLSVGLPFYLTNGGLAGVFAAGVLFWCALIGLLSLQYYLPLRARLGGGFKKNMRKSFIMFFDNPGFSIFLLLYTLVTLVLSFFLAFMAPGFTGIALGLNDAVKLRMLKYDWLEAHPGAKKKDVPWEELLVADTEMVGKRTFKGLIFPWKE